MARRRKYPVRIQSFERLHDDGYIYVDKIPFIYKMDTTAAALQQIHDRGYADKYRLEFVSNK